MDRPIVMTSDKTPWSALAPGIEMQIFHAEPATGIWTTKIWMHAGSVLPPHRHDGASEFFILQGEGVHQESGPFEVGTYAFEPEGVLHSPVPAVDDIVLYMTSYGPGTFLKPNGKELYVADAEYFSKQLAMSALGRRTKHFMLIRIWSLFRKRNQNVDKLAQSDGMECYDNFMVPTENRAYKSIEALPGVGFKPMNILSSPSVWSATLRIEKGQSLPGRRNTNLCEYLVVKGSGQYATGEAFQHGDYFREVEGTYGSIVAAEEVVLFVTNHGSTQFLEEQWCAGPEQMAKLAEG